MTLRSSVLVGFVAIVASATGGCSSSSSTNNSNGGQGGGGNTNNGGNAGTNGQGGGGANGNAGAAGTASQAGAGGTAGGGGGATGGTNNGGAGGQAQAGAGGGPNDVVDTSKWGACQMLAVPAGVTVGKTPLVTMPTVANKCLPSGSGLSRTLNLLATSTPQHHNHVKILYYGQSITRDDANAPNQWFVKVTNWLKQKYPNADIETQMLALGGFDAAGVFPPSHMDLPNFYPDLVIWQNYGGYTDAETDVEYWRAATTAEIGIQTWQCKATDKTLDPTNGDDRTSYIYLPDVAKRLGCEMIDVRTPWRARWNQLNTPVADLVQPDGTHLAATGSDWEAEFTEDSLNYDPNVIVDPLRMVDTYQVGKDVSWNGNKLTLSWNGNRVEVLAQAPGTTPAGAADVLIDGKKPSEFAAAYVYSRPNGDADKDWPWVTDAPTSLSLSAMAKPVVQDWTMTITAASYTNCNFNSCSYTVSGSQTGADGGGTCAQKFTSTSGQVVIDPAGWTSWLSPACSGNEKSQLAQGYQFKWKTIALNADQYPPADLNASDGTKEYWTLLVSNITNGPHTLQLTAKGTTPGIAAIRTFRPPMGRTP